MYEDITSLLNNGTDVSSINPFAGLKELLAIYAMWAIGIVLVIVVIQIISVISRFRSQQATVAMQKDIRAIREILEQNKAASTAHDQSGSGHAQEDVAPSKQKQD